MLGFAVIAVQLLDYITSVVFFSLALYVWLKNIRSPLNRACAWLVASFFVWSFSLVFIHNPFIPEGLVAVFYNLGCLGWASFPALALYFVLILGGTKKIRVWQALIFLPPLFFVGLQWAGVLAKVYPRQAWGWAFDWSPTVWSLGYYFYILLFLTITFSLLIRIWLKSRDQNIRGQARIIFWTGIISLVPAFLVDVILPRLNDYQFPNIAPSFVLIFAGGMIYAITRFNLIVSEAEIMARAEKQWAETFDAMPDGVSIHNLNHEITNVNQAMCRLLGKKREELLGQKCFRVFHGTDCPIAGCPMEKTMTTKKLEQAELFEPRLRRWLAVSTSPLFDEKNQLIQVIHIVRDITERKLAEIELQKLNKAVETAGEAIFLTDREGLITYINPEFTTLYGFTAAEVVGKDTARIIKSGVMKPEDYSAFWSLLLDKKTVKGELINKTKDGRLLNIEGSANPILDNQGNILGFLAIQRDITQRKKMEEELRINSEIMKNMAEGVYLVGVADGIIRFANFKFEKMFGYNPGEMIGKHASIVNAPTEKDPMETAREIMSELNRTNEWHGEVHNIKKDGTTFWCYANCSIFEHHTYGKVIVAVHSDITQRKRGEEALKERESFLKNIVENIPDMIFVKDAKELRFSLFNKAGEDLLGYSRENMYGKNDYDFFTKEQADFFINKDREVLIGKKELDIPEEKIKTREKGERVLHTKKIPILNEKGEAVYLLGISDDITERKKIEEEIIAKNKKLEELNLVKTDFVATVSHELRTPMTIIKEAVSLVLEELYGGINERQKKFLEAAKNNIERLDRLISDLLDVSRIESGKLQVKLAPTNLYTIADKVVKQLKIKAAEKNLFVTLDDKWDKELLVMADPDKTEQVLINLINNSVKYTDKGGITVSAAAQDDFVQVCVADTGIGIAKDNLPKLFDKFMQFNRNTAAGAQGTGLGLAICWGLVEAMQGKIWAESVLGEGSKFYFTLPKVK